MPAEAGGESGGFQEQGLVGGLALEEFFEHAQGVLGAAHLGEEVGLHAEGGGIVRAGGRRGRGCGR